MSYSNWRKQRIDSYSSNVSLKKTKRTSCITFKIETYLTLPRLLTSEPLIVLLAYIKGIKGMDYVIWRVNQKLHTGYQGIIGAVEIHNILIDMNIKFYAILDIEEQLKIFDFNQNEGSCGEIILYYLCLCF